MKKILIIAGGTGGHIFPALVIADALKQQGAAIYWMGAEAGMEKNLVGDKFPLYLLPVKGLRGKSIFEKLKAPFRIIKSVFLAYQHIKKIKPDVVLGMGGYASGPGGIAAKLLGFPLVIHEQNALPGLTNKVLSKVATHVLQAFPNTFSEKTKAVTVGNPIRTSIQKIVRADDYYKTREKPWKILILGGSQGAHFINELMLGFLKISSDDFLVWHQAGKKDFDVVSAAYSDSNIVYRVAPFIDDMDEAYAWADIVIARSGALTVYEVATVGVPAIFIPFPLAVDDHQYHNALFLEKNVGAKIFRESEITAEKLKNCLLTSFSSAEKLQLISHHAKECAKRDAVQRILQYL